MEGAPDAPPPPPAESVPSAVGLPDVGTVFLAEKSHWRTDHEERRRAELLRLQVPLEGEGAFSLAHSATLESLDWSACVEVTCSHGGSAGVFFATFADERRVVLKGSSEPAREIFATNVMRRLGVSAPHLRAVAYSDLEYRKIKEMCEKCLSGEDAHRAKKQLLRPQILLMEFVKGRSLLEMTPELVEQFFSCNKSPKATAKVLRSMGYVLACDVVLNNWDRVPLMHRNEGNFGNLMLQEEGGFLVAIDNGCTGIARIISGRDNMQYSKYLASVTELVTQLAVALQNSEECQLVEQVREKILMGTGIQLSSAEGMSLQRAVAEMLVKLASCGDLFAREREFVASMVPASEDWESVWAKDVERIDLGFFKHVMECLSDSNRLEMLAPLK